MVVLIKMIKNVFNKLVLQRPTTLMYNNQIQPSHQMQELSVMSSVTIIQFC